MTDQEAAALGAEALAEVKPAHVVGLGTGQAATAFIHALGQAVKSGLRGHRRAHLRGLRHAWPAPSASR